MTGYIPITDDRKSLLPQAVPRLFATMLFPMCPSSISQCTSLIVHERSRVGAGGSARHVPSELMQSVLNRLNDKLPRAAAAGLMALAVGLEQEIRGASSKTAAIKAASDITKEFWPRIAVNSFKNGQLSEAVRYLPKAASNLDTAFKEFDKVLPICAAAVGATKRDKPISIYELLLSGDLALEASFVATVLQCQLILSEFYKKNSKIEPWWVDPSGVQLPSKTSVFVDAGTMDWVMIALGRNDSLKAHWEARQAERAQEVQDE